MMRKFALDQVYHFRNMRIGFRPAYSRRRDVAGQSLAIVGVETPAAALRFSVCIHENVEAPSLPFVEVAHKQA